MFALFHVRRKRAIHLSAPALFSTDGFQFETHAAQQHVDVDAVAVFGQPSHPRGRVCLGTGLHFLAPGCRVPHAANRQLFDMERQIYRDAKLSGEAAVLQPKPGGFPSWR